MIPCVDNSVLEQITPKMVPLKPEAPWIKKCSYGIKFTDEIYITDDDRENTPDEEKDYKKKKQRNQERNGFESDHAVRARSEKIILKRDIFAEGNKTQIDEAAVLLQMFKE